MSIQPSSFTVIAACAAAFATGAARSASAQTVLFDFNDAPLHVSLPIVLTVGGLTAQLSATGQGFSIQDASAPVFPTGFSGRFVYPNSIFHADLLVSFDRTLSAFSILYSPQELGCDDSATMRVTAYRNGSFVGTNTRTAAHPGTWPVDTLSCSFPQGFDSVVVHYDGHPPTCTDWGPIFLADDMRATISADVATPICFGDGSGAPCGCNNPGPSGAGCRNGLGVGAVLSASGSASLAADDLVLTASSVTNQPGLFFQGNAAIAGGQGVTFGDGIRCCGQSVVRLQIVDPPGPTQPTTASTSVGIAHHAPPGTVHVGDTKCYQYWYRDPASSPCNTSFNLSSAVLVTWGA